MNQPRTQSRKDQRSAQARAEEAARYARWSENRFAIPYSTDGPKIVFGVAWFVAVTVAIWFSEAFDRVDRSQAWADRIEALSPLALACLLYTSPSPRDATLSRMPSSA